MSTKPPKTANVTFTTGLLRGAFPGKKKKQTRVRDDELHGDLKRWNPMSHHPTKQRGGDLFKSWERILKIFLVVRDWWTDWMIHHSSNTNQLQNVSPCDIDTWGFFPVITRSKRFQKSRILCRLWTLGSCQWTCKVGHYFQHHQIWYKHVVLTIHFHPTQRGNKNNTSRYLTVFENPPLTIQNSWWLSPPISKPLSSKLSSPSSILRWKIKNISETTYRYL